MAILARGAPRAAAGRAPRGPIKTHAAARGDLLGRVPDVAAPRAENHRAF